MHTIEITNVVEGERLRQDLGDIEGLAESIRVNGLIQPIVVRRNDLRLVAGGRRLSAMRSLGWTSVPVTFLDELPDHKLRELELEENIRRKEMTWQERVLSIDEIHKLRQRDAHLTGEEWGNAQTGELLGVSDASVSYATTIARLLRKGDKDITKAEGLTHALRVLVQRREAEAMAALVTSTLLSTPKASTSVLPDEALTVVAATQGGTLDETRDADKVDNTSGISVPLSHWLHRADALTHIASLGSASIDHIVTDPPYAIDMDMLEQQNTGMDVSSVRAEHSIDANLKVLQAFISEAYRVLKDKSFFCMWYDIAHHEKIVHWATKAGFRVQRWPFVWAKTHSCLNQAAQYNFTKATEVCLIARKGNATLVTPQAVNYILEDNHEAQLMFDHPFAKPHNVWATLIEAVSIKGQTIFDPFAGHGSCPCAAIELGRRPYACELNAEHFTSLQHHVRNAYLRLLRTCTFI